MYYDGVVQVEPKRNALREATDTLNAANTKLAEVKELVQTLETNLAALNLFGSFSSPYRIHGAGIFIPTVWNIYIIFIPTLGLFGKLHTWGQCR